MTNCSTLLPADAREILRRAAAASYATEFDRTRAIEHATAKVRQMYPQYFQPQQKGSE